MPSFEPFGYSAQQDIGPNPVNLPYPYQRKANSGSPDRQLGPSESNQLFYRRPAKPEKRVQEHHHSNKEKSRHQGRYSNGHSGEPMRSGESVSVPSPNMLSTDGNEQYEALTGGLPFTPSLLNFEGDDGDLDIIVDNDVDWILKTGMKLSSLGALPAATIIAASSPPRAVRNQSSRNAKESIPVEISFGTATLNATAPLEAVPDDTPRSPLQSADRDESLIADSPLLSRFSPHHRNHAAEGFFPVEVKGSRGRTSSSRGSSSNKGQDVNTTSSAPITSNESQTLLVSKSMPVIRAPAGGSSSVAAGSVQQSKSSDKRSSVKGFTKETFDTQLTAQSPYLEHLKKPNPFAGLEDQYAIHKAIFAKKKDAGEKKKKKTSSGAVDLDRKEPWKFTAVIEESPKIHILSGNPKTAMRPATSAFGNEPIPLKPFSPITAKQWEAIGIRPERHVEDLYQRTQDLQQQQYDRAHKGNQSHPSSSHPTLRSANQMTSKPHSAKMIRATSPTSQLNPFFKSIDQLVSDQTFHNSFRPVSSSPNLLVNSSSPAYPIDTLQQQNHTGEASGSDTGGHRNDKGNSHNASTETSVRIDALEMLANIHIDPLYRIIREEMERIQRQATKVPGQQSVQITRVRVGEAILPAHIKVLSYFQSLPPAVWVTCRLVYFLLVAYYETVLGRPEFRFAREATQLETLWTILDEHYEVQKVTTQKIPHIFSWDFLRTLVKHPVLFCRALDIIENGLTMSNSAWQQFHIRVQQALIAHRDSPSSLPNTHLHQNHVTPDPALLHVTDEDGFRNLFFDRFSIDTFQPLRDMVKAARGFLLSSSATIFTSAAQGSAPLVPGTPLAVSVALTSWVKRVVAALYLSGTQRVRQMLRGQSTAAETTAALTPHPNLPYPMPFSQPSLSPTELEIDALHTSISKQLAPRPHPASLSTAATIVPSAPFSVPPNLSFACIFNGMSPVSLSTVQDNEGWRRYLRFFQGALALVKPSDRLEVLLHSLPPLQLPSMGIAGAGVVEGGAIEDLLGQQIEDYLRHTMASPLHRVVAFDYAAHFPVLNAARVANAWMEAWHPFLAHRMLQHAGLLPTVGAAAGAEKLQSLPRLPQIQPQPQQQHHHRQTPTPAAVNNSVISPVYDVVMAPRYLHADAAKIEPLVLRDNLQEGRSLEEGAAGLAEAIRERANFSLAMIAEQGFTETRRDKTMSGMRYVVAVTDTAASWNAFQMACRLAKESDSITVVHVPHIDLSDMLTIVKAESKRNTVSSLTFAHFQQLQQIMLQRKDRLVALYKTVGYNLLIGPMPTYLQIAQRVMDSYITNNALTTQAARCLGVEANHSVNHPFAGYEYYQCNLLRRHLARNLLQMIQPLQADVVVLGAQPTDVLDALAYHYLHPYLAFRHDRRLHEQFYAQPVPSVLSPQAMQFDGPQPQQYQHRRPSDQLMQGSVYVQQVLDMNQDGEEVDDYRGGGGSYAGDVLTILPPPSEAPLTIVPLDEGEGDEAGPNPVGDVEVADNLVIPPPFIELRNHARVNSQLTLVSALTDFNEVYGNDAGNDVFGGEDPVVVPQRSPYQPSMLMHQISHVTMDGSEDDGGDRRGGYEGLDDGMEEIVEVKSIHSNSVSRPNDVAAMSVIESVTSNGVGALVTASSATGLFEEGGVVLTDSQLQSQMERPHEPLRALQDLDTDSFIVEDNDEGDNSLSASPFLYARQQQPLKVNTHAYPGHQQRVDSFPDTPLSTQALRSNSYSNYSNFSSFAPTPIHTQLPHHLLHPSNNNADVSQPHLQSTRNNLNHGSNHAMIQPGAGMDSGVVQGEFALIVEVSPELRERLQLFRDFARKPLALCDLLLHETATASLWLHPTTTTTTSAAVTNEPPSQEEHRGEVSPLQGLSFVLANLPSAQPL